MISTRNSFNLILERTYQSSAAIFMIALLFVTMLVLSPSLSSSWMSDDYALVYNIYGNPILTFSESLSRTASGLITPHRVLLYWFLGIGGLLGPFWAHALALALHVLCVILFFGLVWRLFRSPLLSLITASWFALAPWIGEPELWWSAVGTTVSSIFILLAAHSFLSSLVSKAARRLFWSVVASVTAFLALCFYDLWLAAPFLYFGIWVLRALEIGGVKRWAFWRSTSPQFATVMTPFVLWCGWVAVIGPRAGNESRIYLGRIPTTFASIHLRVANWFVSLAGGNGPDWPGLWKGGADWLSTPVLMVSFVASLLLIVFTAGDVARRDGRVDSVKGFLSMTSAAIAGFKDGHRPRFPWRVLLFSWMIFLASRLVIVLQGGTALESRLNYGAAMALALAAGSMAWYGWHRWSEKWAGFRLAATVGFGASIALMAVATAGRAHHFAVTSQAEAYTIAVLGQELTRHPEVHSILVVGRPVSHIDESGYFDEAEGFWLPTVLQKLGHQVKVGLAPSSRPSPERPDADAVFIWSGQWPNAQLAR